MASWPLAVACGSYAWTTAVSSPMPERILITGGAGCIGSELAEVLVGRGQDVVVVDNLSSGRIEHLEALRDRPGFTFVQEDLLDQTLLDRVMPGIDTVFHLAANSEVKDTQGGSTGRDLEQNVIATHHLLERMRRHGVRRLAFA